MIRSLLSRLAGRIRRSPRRDKAPDAVAGLMPFSDRSGDAKIAIKRVEHSYRNEVQALRNVNLNIHSGQFVCLLGPSGCGKTTLLYALAGQITPSFGQITIDGRPVRGPSPERLLMFQEAGLFPWLTVRQNLMFALRSRHRDRRWCEKQTDYFLDRVHLQGFESALPHELSGGMRMRASLARALAMEPNVLLMDEPFAALDAQTRAHMHQLLQRVWTETRNTVVFVTHDVPEALVLGDRVVVMAARPGRIIRDLAVPLARPRDPDDDLIVQYAKQIREALREAEAAGDRAGSSGREARRGRNEQPAVRAPAHRVPDRGAPVLGDGG